MQVDRKTVIAALIGVGIAGISFSAGFLVGRRTTLKVAEEVFEERLEKEIEKTRRFYDVKTKSGVFESPESAVENLIPEDVREKLLEYSGQAMIDEDEEPSPGYTVKTTEPIDDFDFEPEMVKQENGEPYIITKDEFFQNEPEYDQTSLTYFEGDDVVCDERDIPLPHADMALGQMNLQFGHGSGDPTVVYIRNDRLELDFEVCKSTGKYSEEVSGFIEHSDKRKVLKFRGDYE